MKVESLGKHDFQVQIRKMPKIGFIILWIRQLAGGSCRPTGIPVSPLVKVWLLGNLPHKYGEAIHQVILIFGVVGVILVDSAGRPTRSE